MRNNNPRMHKLIIPKIQNLFRRTDISDITIKLIFLPFHIISGTKWICVYQASVNTQCEDIFLINMQNQYLDFWYIHYVHRILKISI